MEHLNSGQQDLLSLSPAADELIASLAKPFDDEDADLLRSMGIAPIESDGADDRKGD